MTLRQRLLWQLFAVLGVSLLVMALLAYGRAADKVRTELHAALVVGEQVLHDAVKEIARAQNPFQQLRIVIERFSGGRHLRVILIDKDGQQVAASRLSEPDSPAPKWFVRMIGSQPETATLALPQNVPGYSAFLIEANLTNEAQEVWEDVGYGLIVLSLLSALAASLIYWTIGRELRPLSDINRALIDVAGGDFSIRVPQAASRDLVVSHRFNEMASRFEATEASKTSLEVQLGTVQDEERAELARDLHDEIGPLLFSVGIDAAEAQRILAESGEADALQRLETIREAIKLSQKHVLDMLGRLRNGTVEDLGLEGAIVRLAAFWTARQPHLGIDVDVPLDGVGPGLDPVVYRVVQEGISNAVRHGHANRIEVLVAKGDDGVTRVSVRDDGRGLRGAPPGYGLKGMNERVSARNGVLTITSANTGRGTIVAADFPAETHGQTGLQFSYAGAQHS